MVSGLCASVGWTAVTAFASETCAFDLIDAEYIRDVQPGEVLLVEDDAIESSFPLPKENTAHCVFEHIYFSRPDSLVFGRSVNTSGIVWAGIWPENILQMLTSWFRSRIRAYAPRSATRGRVEYLSNLV